MKKKTLLILVFSVIIAGFSFVKAQNKNSGAGFAYQAVLRDINGDVLNEKEIKLTFSLHTDQTQGLADAWKQTKTLKTDKFGVVKTIVGKADDNKTIAPGFTDINFNEAHYWFKVQLQEGSEALREISFAQLPSTPYSESAFTVSYSVPVGTIVPFAGEAKDIPDGWLLCDGGTYDGKDAKYTELKSVVRHLYRGSASLVGEQFRVPDFRGTFLRGADPRAQGAGALDKDAPRIPGSIQYHAADVRGINGSFTTFTTSEIDPSVKGNMITSDVASGYDKHLTYEVSGATARKVPTRYQTVTITPPTGDYYKDETRPINHAVNYIIKY